MHLRFFAPLYLVLRTVVGAVWVAMALCTTVQAQTAAAITPAALQERWLEAKAQPELEKNLYALGKKVAAVCANCHAAHSRSSLLEVPYLEGQNPQYLMEQIRRFSQGLRKNAFMEGILKAMSRDDMVGMVLFYEREPLPARAAQDTALQAKGKAHYARICISCHASDGRGNERLPRIAGQHYGYVQLTLKRYRDGSDVRFDSNMAFVTQGMTDQDIQAVATYLETMP